VSEQRGGDWFSVGWRRDFDSESGATLLHLGGPDLHIQRAGGEQSLTQGLEVLRTEIVQIC
jgi:hypothetical protein